MKSPAVFRSVSTIKVCVFQNYYVSVENDTERGLSEKPNLEKPNFKFFHSYKKNDFILYFFKIGFFIL